VILGVLLALLTSVSWAFGNVFVQKSGRAIGTVRATLWALVVGGTAAGVLSLALETRQQPISASVLAWTAAAGLAGLLAYGCLFYAFEHAPLTLAVPVVSCWCLIAGLLSFAVFGERPGALPLVGASIVLAGVLLVSLGAGVSSVNRGGPGGASTARMGGRGALVIALGAALGFGVMVPALTQVAGVWGPLGATAVVYFVVVALGLPVALVSGIDVRPPPRAAWGLVLATGCSETLGFVCLALARHFAPMTVVTPVSSLAATLTVLYAWLVLDERPPRLAAAGAALACAGVVMLSITGRR
jgi:drug/metabolite transporter (DMT)-like permease